MSAIIDQTYQPRLWHCEECRAVLGVVLRDDDRVRRLWVQRVQARSAASMQKEIDIIISAGPTKHMSLMRDRWRVMAMDSGIVGCDFYGSLQEWHISDEAMLNLIRRVKGEAGVKEYKRLTREHTEPGETNA